MSKTGINAARQEQRGSAREIYRMCTRYVRWPCDSQELKSAKAKVARMNVHWPSFVAVARWLQTKSTQKLQKQMSTGLAWLRKSNGRTNIINAKVAKADVQWPAFVPLVEMLLCNVRFCKIGSHAVDVVSHICYTNLLTHLLQALLQDSLPPSTLHYPRLILLSM